MSKAILAVILMSCAATTASAEIWKCASKAGLIVYQNFPCQFDSMGDVPSAAPAQAGAARPVTPTAATAASTTEPAKAPRSGTEPTAGMTTEEVKALWGEPADRYEDEQSGGRFMVWEYGGNRSVRFNPKRRVLTVQR